MEFFSDKVSFMVTRTKWRFLFMTSLVFFVPLAAAKFTEEVNFLNNYIPESYDPLQYPPGDFPILIAMYPR
jgi:hypothetical protein